MPEYGPLIQAKNEQGYYTGGYMANPAYTGAPVTTPASNNPPALTNLQKLSIGLAQGTINNQQDVNALYGTNPQMSKSSPTPAQPVDPLASLSPAQRAEFSKQFSIGLSKGQLSDQASVDAFKSSFAAQALGGASPSIYTNQPTVFGAPAGASATQQNNVSGVAGGGFRSRYGTQGELAAEDYLGSFKAPETEEEIQARKLRENQSRIDSINNYYQELVYGQQRVNEQSDREANAQAVLSGLSGSSEAGGMMRESQQRGQQNIAKIQAEKQMQMQQVYSEIQNDAYNAYKDQLTNARQSAADVLALRDAREAKASTQVQTLAQSGIDIDKLAQQDPQTYQYLSQSVGGPEMLKALFTLNRPKESIIDKKVEGGKYIIAYQKPDGSVRIESVDLGLPTGYSKTVDAGDRILAIPDNWNGDPSKLVTISKGLTPVQASKDGSGQGVLGKYPPDISSAAQSIYDGKAKLNEFPSAKRLQINGALSELYKSQGGDQLAQGAYDAAVQLKTDPGFTHAIGANYTGGFFKNIPGSDSASYLAKLDQLKANIKLVNVKYLKGAGALSDAEGKTLEDAGTSLNPNLSETAFKAELDRVITALEKANNVKIANPPSGAIPAGTEQEIDGNIYVSDGTQWVLKQ